MMCASSRMVVKRKGEDRPVVMPCTLLPYDERFVMGHSLGEAAERGAAQPPALRALLRSRRRQLHGIVRRTGPVAARARQAPANLDRRP